MQRPTKEELTCGNKTPYLTYEHAARSLNKKKHRRKREYKGALNVYHCPYCSHWHIGHNDGIER